ncbi:hypothetical protein J4573_46300 [Actinomadura barringtoniae]|uniref:Uncharacterized protein n=1 Tax=Actinomadura barringtoniae TaxID=1427535 RepID=A0A939T9R8_9ACTN|nr:hypothetical protein [Actinomadura barringtoniae]MBO2454569.1 hypothetical protein [Actinomadura barringtoniae]
MMNAHYAEEIVPRSLKQLIAQGEGDTGLPGRRRRPRKVATLRRRTS